MKKNHIYYFTGTGNTLSVAKKIQKELQDSQLIDISKKQKENILIENSDSIGFILPVYVFGAPLIFLEFIKHIKINSTKFIYVIFVHGGAPYDAARDIKEKLLKYDIELNSAFYLVSPDNYISGANPPNAEASKKILKEADIELNDIINSIKTRKKVFPKILFRHRILGKLLRPSFKNIAKKASTKFRVTDKCNGCSICYSLCPKEVINMNELNRPTWSGKDCEMCFSCINLCPMEAIEIGKKTIGRNRYKNPDVIIKDLINKK